MRITRTVPYYFGRVFGLTTAPVSVTAVAGLNYIDYAACPTPIGLDANTFNQYKPLGPGQPGPVVTLKGGQVTSGNWTPLDFAGGGANAYRNELEQKACPPGLKIGDGVPIQTQPGNKVGPTNQAIDYLLAEAAQSQWSGCSASNPCPGDPLLLQIIVVQDYNTGPGKTTWTVSSLQPFWLIGRTGQASIKGRFIDAAIGGRPVANTPCTGATTSNGGCAPYLVQ